LVAFFFISVLFLFLAALSVGFFNIIYITTQETPPKKNTHQIGRSVGRRSYRLRKLYNLQGLFSFDSSAQRTQHKKSSFFVWVLIKYGVRRNATLYFFQRPACAYFAREGRGAGCSGVRAKVKSSQVLTPQ
jgi:hypothetical protein